MSRSPRTVLAAASVLAASMLLLSGCSLIAPGQSKAAACSLIVNVINKDGTALGAIDTSDTQKAIASFGHFQDDLSAALKKVTNKDVKPAGQKVTDGVGTMTSDLNEIVTDPSIGTDKLSKDTQAWEDSVTALNKVCH